VVAARDPLYAPELAAEGLEAHRPHTVLLFGTDNPDELVDVTTTIDAKLAALRGHASQFGDHADLDAASAPGTPPSAPTPPCSTPRPSTSWTRAVAEAG
jgi:LmbE family N-acetylglucosaminyl deacetylase